MQKRQPNCRIPFVLCIEVLVLLVKNSNVEPYQTKTGYSILNDTYADDLTFFPEYRQYDQYFNMENTRTLLDCLKKFEKWSGLKVNEGKTQVTVFGGKYQKPDLVDMLNLKW